ncbi:D-alanyl-D-alanine carboxypeptidase family protein [Neobacillus piezotolerans]|uniref:D-alanyl-D-alanine carboxypeptidase family protein n=1 Tax=Neobacillus piezotolerans TaxID=2259171 RepID=A0A3D8GPN5_9BACI|nr:M15 family metallopeptidase [Neobacillus piezotolerans]RDU36450.1 D-alanyl-D-alanine carboxypeptidase family protein [Neobacillus piezotolerans]
MKRILLIISSWLLLSGCSEMDALVKKIPILKDRINTESSHEQEGIQTSGRKEQAETASQTQDGPVLEAAYFNQIAIEGGRKEIQNPDNILVLVNKEFSLSGEYRPNDLVKPEIAFSFGDQDLEKSLIRQEAAKAIEEMFKKAKEENIELFAVSGYRSYDRQKDLFDAEVKESGEELATQAVALPGQSEHQTGLTMDIASKSTNLNLTQEFGETPEGKWLAANAHKFGFILRYPKGKESITQYQYEPWHFRYVGNEAAKVIFEKDWTLEEFFQQVKKI